MLQAQIDILDADGNTEESVKIIGAGTVAIGDDVAIEYDGRHIVLQVKASDALKRDDEFLPTGTIPLAQRAIAMFALRRGRTLRVEHAVMNSESNFRRQADQLAAATGPTVIAELEQLRARGAIDEHGNLLGPLPPDMQPGSRTDV